MRTAVVRVMVGCAMAVLSQTLAAQEGVVAGVVVDTRGPVAQVRVQVVGAERATVTNDAGHFRITQLVPGPITLHVTRLGYQEKTLTAAVGDTAVRVVIAALAVNIDQIVVTGAPEATSTRSLGNAISTIDAASITATAPVTDVTEVLTSRAPGVVVTQGSGVVGAGARINLRGSSSMSLTDQPIIYIDGVRVDNSNGQLGSDGQSSPITRLNDLNPDDIQSVEIIMGPAASTLYGTEADNGVVQIITKHGTANTPARFAATAQSGGTWFQNPQGRLPDVWAKDSTGSIITLNPYNLSVQQGQAAYRTGALQQYDLNVSGGAEKIRYYIDGNYENDGGIETNTGVSTERARANVAVDLKHLSLGANLAYSGGTTSVPSEGVQGGTMYALYSVQPTLLNTYRQGWNFGSPRQWQDAFLFADHSQNFVGGGQAQYHLGTWFTTHLNVGINQINEDASETVPQMSPALAAVFGSSLGAGSATDNLRNSINTTADWGASANAALSKTLVSTTSVGLQYYHMQNQTTIATGRGFPAIAVTEVGAAGFTNVGTAFLQNNTVGTYLQEQLAFSNLLFLTGALRADDNSAFGKDFAYVLYPKASVSWVLSDEPFWHVAPINTLKLRAAFGESGQQPQAFDALRTFTPVPYGGPGGTNIAAVTPGTTGNPDLKPEVATEVELGFDAGLFGERAGVQLTYYDKRTRDAIVQRSLSPSDGFPGSQFINLGALRNSGLEILVNGRPIDSRRVQVDLTLTAATNNNVVENVGNSQGYVSIGAGSGDFLYTGTQRFANGLPAGAWFSQHVVSATLDPASGLATNILCANGKGGTTSCANAPQVYLGRSQPNFTGAFTPAITLFNRLHVYALLAWQTGYLRPDDNYTNLCQSGVCAEDVVPQRFNPVRIARYQLGLYDDFTMQNASFIRLREVSASYTLPAELVRHVGASGATVTIAARNLWLGTPFTGLDPESGYVAEQFIQTNYAITPALASLVGKITLTY